MSTAFSDVKFIGILKVAVVTKGERKPDMSNLRGV